MLTDLHWLCRLFEKHTSQSKLRRRDQVCGLHIPVPENSDRNTGPTVSVTFWNRQFDNVANIAQWFLLSLFMWTLWLSSRRDCLKMCCYPHRHRGGCDGRPFTRPVLQCGHLEQVKTHLDFRPSVFVTYWILNLLLFQTQIQKLIQWSHKKLQKSDS